ncbi:hypothetical protein ACROYT_G015307 [Oculina patagonica]
MFLWFYVRDWNLLGQLASYQGQQDLEKEIQVTKPAGIVNRNGHQEQKDGTNELGKVYGVLWMVPLRAKVEDTQTVKVSPKDPPIWSELLKHIESLERENVNLKIKCKTEEERSKQLCIENSNLNDRIKDSEQKNKELEEKNAQQQKHIDEVKAKNNTLLERNGVQINFVVVVVVVVYSLFLMTEINLLAHRKLEKVLLHGFLFELSNNAKERRQSKPAHVKAPVSKTNPERIKLTLQGQRLQCAELERELNEMRAELEKANVEVDHELRSKILNSSISIPNWTASSNG